MKIILVLILLIIPFIGNTYPQDSMFNSQSDTVTKRLGERVEYSQTTPIAVFQSMADHKKNNAIGMVVMAVICLIAMIEWRHAYISPKEEWTDNSGDGPTLLGLVRFIEICIIVLFSIGFMIDLRDTVGGINNPEAEVISELLNKG